MNLRFEWSGLILEYLFFSSSTEKAKTDKASLTFSRLRKPVGNTKPKVIIVLFVCINRFFIYLHKCQSTMFI